MGGILDSLRGLMRTFGGGGPQPRSEGLVYAVGDIHGRRDLLEPLFEKLVQDAIGEEARHGAARPPVVFLGDMVDRGPDTRGTLEFLDAIRERPEIETIFLRGNHEEMLLQFLADPVTHRRWLLHGGYETLESYGLGRVGDLEDPGELARIAGDLKAAMGPHVDLLEACATWYEDGNLAFVHAGADPDLPVQMQSDETLIWGCEAFERKRRRDGAWVVHGHTIVEKPVIRHNRIPIDTGAYLTGVLTALKARGTELDFISHEGGMNPPAN